MKKHLREDYVVLFFFSEMVNIVVYLLVYLSVTYQIHINIQVHSRIKHSMVPNLLESCELKNEFSTNFHNYIRNTQNAMLPLRGD